ncbi:uncharacterized protein [Miscanthus floridulus]|uniref:uncharacterized protein n=1 Tax=Miscanthus floridulus TaxID=154761 RepID=UPI003457DDD0
MIVSLAGAPPPPLPPPATAMDRFPDGMHVWLRSTLRGAYLFADDDGSGVSLSTCREMMNAAWQVQRVVLRDGTPFFFLQTAAYGRYLALSPYLAPHGHRGRRAILRDFHEPHQRNIRWRAIAAGDGSDDVLLCTLQDQERYLRAHGWWRTCSCITVDGRRSTMTHWTVVQIPPRPAPPVLPTPSTDLGGRGGRTDWQRTIRYMRANDEGNFLGTKTFKFKFSGRSVFKLRNEVATQGDEDMFTITLCVHTSFYGRLTPLVVDLPREDPLDIVVLPTSSPAAMALVHPDIGPPPPPPPGIDLLTDGAFVRLKCRLHGQYCYLHAQGDGLGVNLRPEATSLQEVWAVEQLEIDGDDFLLFRGAAYGRYFALMPEGKIRGSHFA